MLGAIELRILMGVDSGRERDHHKDQAHQFYPWRGVVLDFAKCPVGRSAHHKVLNLF